MGEFRRTAVPVPTDEVEAPLTADLGGVRWIYVSSDESALARFALARGEGDREWAYQRRLGARLLDAMVPAVGGLSLSAKALTDARGELEELGMVGGAGAGRGFSGIALSRLELAVQVKPSRTPRPPALSGRPNAEGR